MFAAFRCAESTSALRVNAVSLQIDADPVGDVAESLEYSVMQRCNAEMAAVQRLDPAWFELFEEVSVFNAPRDELVDLMNSAPNAFMRGQLLGVFMMRVEMEAVTDRPFI